MSKFKYKDSILHRGEDRIYLVSVEPLDVSSMIIKDIITGKFKEVDPRDCVKFDKNHLVRVGSTVFRNGRSLLDTYIVTARTQDMLRLVSLDSFGAGFNIHIEQVKKIEKDYFNENK